MYRGFEREYSRRAWLTAAFVGVAMVLGGGGSLNPLTEALLEAVFAVFVVAWLWVGRGRSREGEGERPAFLLSIVALILVLPLAQLVPLPPSWWQGLPGRGAAVAALELVGQEGTLHPLSLSPSRTLAALLAMSVAAFLFYAVARLDGHERRLLLGVIVAFALANVLFGMLQVVSPHGELNFYRVFSRGWVTGFQANRNHAADVLLIGILALAALTFGGAQSSSTRLPAHKRRTMAIISAVTAAVMLIALVMTGSRMGMALTILALGGSGLIFLVSRGPESRGPGAALIVSGAAVVALVGIVVFTSDAMAVMGRAVDRLDSLETLRGHVWEDTLFAIRAHWPFGVGMGGFGPAIFAAERLEFVDPSFPNRAHNDYLEFALEAGLPGILVALVMAGLIGALGVRAWASEPHSRQQIAFGTTVLLLVAAHSIVDYPLRTMAVSCLVAVAAGLMTKAGPARRPGAGARDQSKSGNS